MEGETLSHPTYRNTAGRSHFSSAVEPLSSLRCMETWFEAVSEAPVARGRVSESALPMTLCWSFNWRAMLAGGCWRCCRSDWQVRLEPPSRQDSFGAFRTARSRDSIVLEERSPTRSRGASTFLGFTHFWARPRRGRWMVKRKTASDRITPGFLRRNQRVVSRQPACTPRLAACTPSQQAARAQRVLWDHRELAVPEQRAPAPWSSWIWRKWLQSPLAKAQHALEAVSASLEAVPATEPESLCCGLQSRVANP